MWRAGREAIALAARCAHLARERGVSSSSSSHARWSFGKKSGKHRRGPPTTGAMGGGSLTASQFEEEAHRLASGDGVVFFKDKITQITQGAVDVSLPGRDDAYYNAPGDYAGVAIRSSLRWPMPMDDLAKLNPKLALAMGQSRQQVANANRGREALNPVGNPNTRAAHGALSADDAPTATDPRVMDGDELAIVKMLEEDRLEAMRKEAFALVEGRERRRRETERENAPKPERRERTVGAREMAAQLATERARVDRKLEALERRKEELRLAEEWESHKAAGEAHKILPKPGSAPGATPAVYEHLKRHMLDRSNEKLAATQTNAALTETALARLSMADLRRACQIVGLPTVGKKKTLTQMLHAHFKQAEHHFARAFIEAQKELDRDVRRLKRQARSHARAAAEEERAERAAVERATRARAPTAGAVRRRGRPPKPELEEERARKAAKAAAEAESLGLALGTLEYADEDEDEDEEGAEGAEELTDARDAPALSAGEPKTEGDDDDNARPNPSTGRMNYVEAFDPEELVRILLKAKGADVVVIPVKEKCNWTDHFVVGTAKSPRHIRMLAGAVLHAVKKRTRFIVGNKLQPAIEGADAGDGETPGDDHWMLVDCGSCVVHVFSPEARRRFDLEGLWAPGVPLERRNAEGGALTIDTITADGDDDDDDDEIEIDLDDMPGTLDDYEDAYLESPSWERSITDEEQERVRRRGASRRDSGFGEAGVNLD